MTNLARGLAGILLGAISSCASEPTYKGLAFDGGVQVLGLERLGSLSTVEICIEERCEVEPADVSPTFGVYPFDFGERGRRRLPNGDVAVDTQTQFAVRVVVTDMSGKSTTASTQARLVLARPAACYGLGPVLAVQLTGDGDLRASSPDLNDDGGCDSVRAANAKGAASRPLLVA